jgi:hypothetical protein
MSSTNREVSGSDCVSGNQERRLITVALESESLTEQHVYFSHLHRPTHPRKRNVGQEHNAKQLSAQAISLLFLFSCATKFDEQLPPGVIHSTSSRAAPSTPPLIQKDFPPVDPGNWLKKVQGTNYCVRSTCCMRLDCWIGYSILQAIHVCLLSYEVPTARGPRSLPAEQTRLPEKNGFIKKARSTGWCSCHLRSERSVLFRVYSSVLLFHKCMDQNT